MNIEYKGYSINSDGTFGMKLIRGIGKGALPKALKGAFSDERNAKKAIDNYLGTKGVSNGKEQSAA